MFGTGIPASGRADPSGSVSPLARRLLLPCVMRLRRSLAIFTLVLALAPRFAPAEGSQATDPGAALAERLLAAMGGREAWSRVTFVHVEAIHDDLDLAEPFVNRIWNDFSEPRVRFWAGNEQFTNGRKIAAGTGVREAGPQAGTPLTAEQYESDRAWWEANVYRTLHRMAKRDAGLAHRASSASRLEVLRSDGTVLNWFVLNQKGEPMLFGSGRDTRGTAFGPLTSSDRVRYPKWGARADGSWRYEIRRFVTAETVPPGTFDAMPAGR